MFAAGSFTTIEWVLGSIAALIVIFGGALPAVRTSRAKATIDLQATEIEARDKALAAQEQRFKDALDAMERRCSKELSEMDRRHAREMGELSGQVNAMTPDFAKKIAEFLKGEGMAARGS